MATVERDDRGIWKKALVAIPAVVVLGMLVGLLSNSGMENGWYAGLDKPGIQPPPWLFGPIWAALYALMALALAVIWNEPPSSERTVAMRLFFAQLLLNYAWSPIFFGGHMIDVALVVLIVLLLLALMTAKSFRRIRPMAGWLLLPYLLWLCLAVALNYETGKLNPRADAAPLGITGA
jgi:benzodiazapine receptor